ncbi:MAG: aminotransferase class I/II-fold pyridoxal phosphate-dependent enzyme, partial [Cellulomonadaceae bacterium]|nr:aminotransferase class I/II-fold pyridoxal phosphate-dependent enzyme [Cellulomonadaceae bacterium]
MHPNLTPDDLRRLGGLKWTGIPSAIAAWVAESDLGTAPAVTAALHDAVDRGMTGYLPPAVDAAMRAACADWQRERFGWSVPDAWVSPVADVVEALRLTVEHFSRSGSALIVPTPAYMPFLTTPLTWGRQVIQLPMVPGPDGPTIDLVALDRAFTDGGGVLTLVNPHNPTGRVMSSAELAAIAEVVEHHGGRVFADEVHAPLVHAGHRHVPYASVSPLAAGHTVTATSASKGWNVAGLKCAQLIVSNDADAAAWAPLREAASHGASTLGVIANTAAYAHGGAWLDGMLRELGENVRTFTAELAAHAPAIGFTPPAGTYLAWLDLRPALAELGDQ